MPPPPIIICGRIFNIRGEGGLILEGRGSFGGFLGQVRTTGYVYTHMNILYTYIYIYIYTLRSVIMRSHDMPSHQRTAGTGVVHWLLLSQDHLFFHAKFLLCDHP